MGTSKKGAESILPHTIPLPEVNSTNGDYLLHDLPLPNNANPNQNNVFSTLSSKQQQ